jgi:hypothetical protein
MVAPGRYRERKDANDYNAMLQELHVEVGRRGLELAFQSRYMGMGDSEKQLMIAKRQSGYIQTQTIASAFSPEMVLQEAIDRVKVSKRR